jgi:RNA polymerase sigma factor (TIGR02999 family)
MTERSSVTRLLQKWSDGDDAALDRLVPLLYEEMRGLARARMRAERTGHSLDTTDLVHEAFLRLVDLDRMEWRDRRHFLAMTARVMRRVLIDHARRASAEKRGGGRQKVALDDAALMTDAEIDSLLMLDQLLERLEEEHPRAAAVLEQRYFGGFTSQEIAQAMDVSASTVERDLRFARAWLAEQAEARDG